ncbi:hypothetical protein [Chryseobacterium chendengshani]|uniref:hypothetical protein n=1 Tax=Chryseobacterium sp. LJ756 TaxID=2864113 RepID=UPI001C63C3D4|nr:hypothetical protein [Chryseobacterium sp. LJ756]MBW7674660.1 hypothetical protein [Chryseobacterium sp. LJ756]
MKKLLLLGAFAFFGSAAHAQEGLKLGGHIGAPVGDASKYASFTFGVDGAYMWNIAKNFDLGVATGYSHFVGKDYDFKGNRYKSDDFGFIPVAVAGKYRFAKAPIFVALDLGYAVSVKDGVDGGLYAQPKFGYQTTKLELYVGYQTIGSRRDFDRERIENNFGAINFGVNFFLK